MPQYFCPKMRRIISSLCLFFFLFHLSSCAGKITGSQTKVQKHTTTEKPKQEPEDEIRNKQNTTETYHSLFSLEDESTSIKPFEQDKHATTNRVLQEALTASQIRSLPVSATFPTQTHNPREPSSTASSVSNFSVTGVSLEDASVDPNNTVFEIDLMMCDESGGSGNVTGDHGTVRISRTNISGTFAASIMCRLRITGSPGSFLFVSFDKLFSPKEFNLHVIITDYSGFLYAIFFKKERPPNLYFTFNWMELLLLSNEPFHPVTLLTFISNPSPLYLNLTFLTDTYGFVTTPFFDGVSTKYPPKLNASATIRLPREYSSLMVSFKFFALKYLSECITFFQAANATVRLYNVLLRVCGTDRLKTYMFNVSLKIEFATDLQITTLGFKMLFSFHTKEDEPRFARTGRYNCTSQNYELFKQHVECNLHEECENGEDELGCWYTSTNCKGAIAYENGCYSYVTWKASVTWNEASRICSLHNSELASLNTVEKTKYILNTIQRQRRWLTMYVGLKTSDPNLPKMYRRALQWNNGKMALDLNFDRHEAPKYPSCGMVGDDEEWAFTMIDCNKDILTQFLCEFPHKGNNKNEDSNIPLQRMNPNELRLRLPATTTCPDGHVTHDFLSCDPATDCSKDVFVDTCETENGGVIPLFICEDGVQTLAFTLVCNHQQDCRDGSDEDRCVFEACEGFLCDNLQCVRVGEVCDGMAHCLTGRDEERCSEVTSSSPNKLSRAVNTSIVTLDGIGHHDVINYRSQGQVKVVPFLTLKKTKQNKNKQNKKTKTFCSTGTTDV